MKTFTVHSDRGSHLGFVKADNTDAAYFAARARFWNAYSVRHFWQLDSMTQAEADNFTN